MRKLCFCVFTILFLSSCDAEEVEPINNQPELIGTWKQTKFEYVNYDSDGNETGSSEATLDPNIFVFDFNSDGKIYVQGSLTGTHNSSNSATINNTEFTVTSISSSSMLLEDNPGCSNCLVTEMHFIK